MTRYSHLDPNSFFLQGGSMGVLLIHGFTGAPTEMRLLGDYLHLNHSLPFFWVSPMSESKNCRGLRTAP